MLVGRYGRNTLDYSQLVAKLERHIQYYLGRYNAGPDRLRVLLSTEDMKTIWDSTKWVGSVSLDRPTLRPRILGVLAYEVPDINTTVVLCDV